MEWRVLGPLEAVEGGRRLALGGKRQRAVLAALLLHRNRPVSIDALVDSLWGEHPPATAEKTVQVYISRLRKLLPDDRLEHGAAGYVLCVDDDELDLARVEAAVAAAENAEPAVAAASLREALSEFRGAPFAELDFAQAEKARIEELRLAALEARVDVELALGDHVQLVGELEQLVAEHPLSERLRAQLMLALYRSGRQAEALAVFRETRRALLDEVGLEPGPELQQLEVRILNHDPALLPARTDAAESERIRALLARGRERVAAEMSGGGELEEAREAALALGDPETAAEAESWLGQLAWVRGDQAGSFSHLERARALTERRPPSKTKTLVLDLLARRHMTAASYADAVRFGREALELCTALGDDAGRAEISIPWEPRARSRETAAASPTSMQRSRSPVRMATRARSLARVSISRSRSSTTGTRCRVSPRWRRKDALQPSVPAMRRSPARTARGSR